MIRKMHLGVTLAAAAALASVAAFAGTAMAGGVVGADRVALVGGPFGGDGGFGAATFLPALGGANASSTLLRFVNAGSTAGTVTLTLYDAGTGAQVAAYKSASIPSAAGLQVTLSQVISGATPTLGSSDQTRVYNVAATATFHGTVQALLNTGSAIVNQVACGVGGRFLGYVEGPGFTNVTGAIRLSNPTTTAGTATFSIRDAATGTVLGTYTSASVPAHGTVTVSTAALAAASTPVIPASTAALNIVQTAETARLNVAHLATVTGQTVASHLTPACGLHD